MKAENILHIAEGVVNKFKNVLGVENEIVENEAYFRLQICNECPLISEDKKNCDKNKATIHYTPEGVKTVNGCGCILEFKVRSNSKCPLNNW